MITAIEWRNWYPAADYDQKKERSKALVFHFLLALDQKEESLCDYMNKKIALLTAKDDKYYNLTPLMIAVMKGRTVPLDKLLTFDNVKAAINEQDQFGWSALHHAALGSQAVFDRLVAHGADRNLRTRLGATADDLKALISLDSEGSSIKNVTIPPEAKLSHYRDLPYFGPHSYKDLWQLQRDPLDKTMGEIQNGSLKLPPLKFTVVKMPEGYYGLTTDQEIGPRRVIGAYAGEFYQTKKKEYRPFLEVFSPECKKATAYLFQRINAREMGNATRFINCGFPNLAPGAAHFPGVEQPILFAIETIKKGECLYFDYGCDAADIIFGPQIIYNKEKMHAFFKPGLNALLKKLAKFSEDRSFDYEFVRFTTFLFFPLNNPIALLHLHYAEIVSAKVWLKCLWESQNHTAVDIWARGHGREALNLKALLTRVVLCEHRMPKNLLPVNKQFFRKHLESLTLMKFSKALELMEKSFGEEGILQQLETYDWTQDEANIYSEKSHIVAQENEFNRCTLPKIKRGASEFLPLRRELIQASIEENKQNPGFIGSEVERHLHQIANAVPQSVESYIIAFHNQEMLIRGLINADS